MRIQASCRALRGEGGQEAPRAGAEPYTDLIADRIVDNLRGFGPEEEPRPEEPRPEDRLRAAIVSGQLQPNQRLIEAELTRTLGIGRAAVRTALARLEQEGLVEHERHRGARVRLVDEREAVEILEIRAVLEGLAARYAALRAQPSEIDDLRYILAEMRRLIAAGDLLAASDRNADLHRRLIESAAHPTAARLISSLRSQLVRFQYRTILLPGRSERSLEEHQAIIEAIAQGDPEAAEAAMRTHLFRVAQALSERSSRSRE